jgi:hypothetical protein
MIHDHLTENIINRSPTYNGWTNYETWCVALWLSNEEGMYHTIRELVRDVEDRGKAAGAIRAYLEALNPLADQASVFADLINEALRQVNWLEVAESFING